MRVFILCTGRSGSMTFVEACKHITNYTSGHETLSLKTGNERFNYPDMHIESDNRLSWYLGLLDKNFDDDAYYVHLIRDKKKTVASHNRRWNRRTSIVKAFAEGVLKTPAVTLSKEKKLQICSDYYDCVNANIELFLKDKSKIQTIHLEKIKEGFNLFWKNINAEGNKESALKEFDQHHNKSEKTGFKDFLYDLKLFLLRILSVFRKN